MAFTNSNVFLYLYHIRSSWTVHLFVCVSFRLLFSHDLICLDNSGPNIDTPENNGSIVHSIQRDSSSSDLGPLKDNERLDINCAVKEYLLLAGYRLTAMTFYEEVPSSKTLVLYFSSF